MSDSSEDEDLSKFKEVVDSSFLTKFNSKTVVSDSSTNKKCKTNRYLEVSSHYNDVMVPEEMQKRIGAKVSSIIHRSVQFVDVPLKKMKKSNIKGGVKLFRSSSDFLSCEDVKDTQTELHNMNSKKIKIKRRTLADEDIVEEYEKLKSAVVSGDYVLSGEETCSWKSRRKEKVFKYKSKGNSKVLVSIE